MSSAYYSYKCPYCKKDLDIGVMDKGPSMCVGGAIVDDRYLLAPKQSSSVKILDVVCKSCGTEITVEAPTKQDDRERSLSALLNTERSTCGALTIKHLGGGTPGLVNFSELYPRPPQADNQGNIPLPVGGEIRVFNACVGDIYIFRRIDPPIQVINESQTGYFSVSLKLHNQQGFTKTAHIWGKAVVAQHPHLQNAVTYEIEHPNDRIHLTYHVFRTYLLDNNLATIDQLVEMNSEDQYEMFLKAVGSEKA